MRKIIAAIAGVLLIAGCAVQEAPQPEPTPLTLEQQAKEECLKQLSGISQDITIEKQDLGIEDTDSTYYNVKGNIDGWDWTCVAFPGADGDWPTVVVNETAEQRMERYSE